MSYLLKFNLIQSGSITAAAMIASGAFQVKNGQIILSGSEDVIIALTIFFAAFLVKFLTPKLGSYTVLLLPLIVSVVAGGVGQFMLPYTKIVTGAVGRTIGTLTNFQPLVMGMLMGIAFAALIVSPIPTEGIASGSANLGITACAFILAIMSSKVNGFGTTIAHFIGTPKIQMANMLKNPRLFLPVIASAGIAGLVGAIFEISGTANSAIWFCRIDWSDGSISRDSWWTACNWIHYVVICGDANFVRICHEIYLHSKVTICS